MAENYSRDLKDILRKHGCTFARYGKGDYEIWHSPITNCQFMVDNKIKAPMWANIVLKKAGFPKTF
jgi:hypothetical protein